MPLSERRSVEVNISGNVAKERLRRDLTIPEIRTLEAEKGDVDARQTLGFTTYEMKSSFSFNLQFFRQNKDSSKGCAWLQNIDASFNVPLVDIFIPSEYPEGSCEYREIQKHENEHVKILKDTHSEFLGILKTTLMTKGALPDASAPQEFESYEIKKKEIEDDLKLILDDFMEDFSKTLNKRQRAIDIDENYAAITSRCEAWERR
ncbi:MAG: hypothetical protein GYA55_03290 [SAR324 cluster bacterium]|uniref:DUF922 domain-containing protein n=1 Tax=SAR324 cluster bacterium TaxID=2024889 RepID=A0A7X9FQT6_9DELT|nr:hypothetical protein [SAR324 cluster bacterium]